MRSLVELSNETHKGFHVKRGAQLDFIRTQHMLQVRASEIPRVAADLPVFFNRHPQTGRMMISAITSFTPSENLLVENDQWQAVYHPSFVQTHPFYLMVSPKGENSYTIGIDETGNDFTQESGEALFTQDGRATLFLSQIKKSLETSIEDDMQTARFLDALSKLDLFKEIDLLLMGENGQNEKIKGLWTINEEKLGTLDGAQLESLHSQGYLVAVYSLLTSIFQLNRLIKKHSAKYPDRALSQVKLEVAKGPSL